MGTQRRHQTFIQRWLLPGFQSQKDWFDASNQHEETGHNNLCEVDCSLGTLKSQQRCQRDPILRLCCWEKKVAKSSDKRSTPGGCRIREVKYRPHWSSGKRKITTESYKLTVLSIMWDAQHREILQQKGSSSG